VPAAAVLVDASAFIALLDEDDAAHERCSETLRRLQDPLVTACPAVAEAMHMLADIPRGTERLCELLAEGGVQILELHSNDFRRIKELMVKYRDLPMDFADAALVRVAERDGLTRIITFDSDFRVYRLPRRGRFTVLP
jgi:predicted nucleic acid-binding protein